MDGDVVTQGAGAGSPANDGAGLWNGIKRRFGLMLGLDLRTLALFRAIIASLSLIDLWNRAPDIEMFYTDFGVLPRATYIEQFANKNLLSLHMFGGSVLAMSLLFIAHAIVAACLFVGWRTRIVSVLAWIFTMSLHGRNPYVLQGGDVLLRMLYFWAMFLPLGARWSVDAALAKPSIEPQRNQVTSAATIAIIMQAVFVYWFTMTLKTGAEWWRDYTAVHYAMNLDMFATPVAVWLRQFPDLMKALTATTAWVEILVPAMAIVGGLFAPIRLLAIVMMVGLHIIFGSALKIGLFPFVSSLSWIIMTPGWVWDKLGARSARRLPGVTLDTVGVAAARWASLVKTGLLLQSSTLTSAPTADGAANAITVRSANGAVVTGTDAVQAVLRASFIAPFRWLASLSGVVALLARPVTASALGGRVSKRLAAVRERTIGTRAHPITNVVVLGLLAYVFAWNVNTLENPTTLSLSGNQITVHPWKLTEPEQALAYTLRLDQTWNMFAPRPMKSDGWYIIPGLLSDGRVVDLFKDGAEVAWEKPEWVSSQYKSQRWRKYMNNIWLAQFKKQRRNFAGYLCRLWNRDLPTGTTLRTFNIIYMREDTTDDGVAPVECQSIWTQWCDGGAKNLSKQPYMEQCDAITKAGKAERAAQKAAEVRAAEEAAEVKAAEETDDADAANP